MKNRRNYYRVLHVQPDAPPPVIQSSYRTLMQKLRMHPDLGGDAGNAALINEAYAVLSDPEKRAAYDATHSSMSSGRQSDADNRSAPGRARSAPQNHTAILPRCLFCDSPQPAESIPQGNDLCHTCHSPLTPVSRIDLETDHRRAAFRIALRGQVRILADWRQSQPTNGQITDLSPYGIGIRSTHPFHPGTLIRVEGKSLTAIARISSCRRHTAGGKTPHLLGAEFLTLGLPARTGAFVSLRT